MVKLLKSQVENGRDILWVYIQVYWLLGWALRDTSFLCKGEDQPKWFFYPTPNQVGWEWDHYSKSIRFTPILN